MLALDIINLHILLGVLVPVCTVLGLLGVLVLIQNEMHFGACLRENLVYTSLFCFSSKSTELTKQLQ